VVALDLKGKDVMAEPLAKRRALIESHVLPKLADPIRYSPILDGSLDGLIQSVKVQGLEGLTHAWQRWIDREVPGSADS
jgi:ATP-dependent DNA ligase